MTAEDQHSQPAKVSDGTVLPSTDLSRRKLLRSITLAVGGAAAFGAIVTSQQAEAAMTQAAAGYQTTPKDGHSCSNCAVFVAPSSCKLVAGTINPSGWCRFYSPKS